jgi:DNA replication protein DnaD
MPPHHETSVAEGKGAALTPAQIETIKMWIDQGAKNN